MSQAANRALEKILCMPHHVRPAVGLAQYWPKNRPRHLTIAQRCRALVRCHPVQEARHYTRHPIAARHTQEDRPGHGATKRAEQQRYISLDNCSAGLTGLNVAWATWPVHTFRFSSEDCGRSPVKPRGGA